MFEGLALLLGSRDFRLEPAVLPLLVRPVHEPVIKEIKPREERRQKDDVADVPEIASRPRYMRPRRRRRPLSPRAECALLRRCGGRAGGVVVVVSHEIGLTLAGGASASESSSARASSSAASAVDITTAATPAGVPVTFGSAVRSSAASARSCSASRCAFTAASARSCSSL